MRDPRHRLSREVLGDSVLGPRRMLVKVRRPELVRPRLVAVPDRTTRQVLGERPYSHIPDPGPNAPKLIRLIRNPVSQELGHHVRNKDMQRRFKTEWLKPESAKMVREALLDRERPPCTRARRDRPGDLDRPRASAEAWLLISGKGE